MTSARGAALGVCLAVVLAAAPSHPAVAQDRSAYGLVATKLMLKVLTYDKAFGGRGQGDFVVVVASEAGQAQDRAALIEALGNAGLRSILSRPLKFTSVEYTGKVAFDEKLEQANASAVLAVPGLSKVAAEGIREATASRQLYSLGIDDALVERGFVLGVATHNGRPQIVINLQSSKDIGATFEAAILKLARVVQ